MLTDLGTQFTPELVREVSILQAYYDLYHPMCNELVEKFNCALKQMLKKMCREQHKDWDKYINAVLFAYRGYSRQPWILSIFILDAVWAKC